MMLNDIGTGCVFFLYRLFLWQLFRVKMMIHPWMQWGSRFSDKPHAKDHLGELALEIGDIWLIYG